MKWFCVVALLPVAVLGCSTDEGTRGPTATGESSSVVIGPRGGVVEAEGVRLSIPDGALTGETLIEIVSTREAPEGGNVRFSPVYRFSPSGLHFARPAEVQVDFIGSSDRAGVFWSDSSESQFELLETTVKGATARAPVTHFSLGFVGDAASGSTPSGEGGAGGVTGEPGNPMTSDSTSNDAGGAGGMMGGPGDPMSSGGAPNEDDDDTCRRLDLFVLVQATASMHEDSPATGGTWWELVTDQLESFFALPRNAGTRVGLTFIGDPVTPVPCDASAYERLDVALGELPGHASALTLALDEREVAGSTALSEAFQGMVSLAHASATSNPSRTTAMLFVTNATATACNTPNAVAVTAQVADEAYNLRIPTVVAGVGMEYQALDQIASAGGTDHTFLIEDPNFADRLGDFFAKLRGCWP